MRALAEQEGIGGRVTLHGWISSAQVAQLMADADILLMTSLHEGLPMVAIEALQWGLAIVGSQIGGMRDVVEEGRNGFLCELLASRLRAKASCIVGGRGNAGTNASRFTRKGGRFRS